MCIPMMMMMSFVGDFPYFSNHTTLLLLHKIVVFEDAFERLMDIIEMVKYSDGGQCLSVCMSVCFLVCVFP